MTDMHEIALLEKTIPHIIPKFREVNELLVSLLDISKSSASRVVDLGCGFGELTHKVLEFFPTAQVFGVDREVAFLQKTREKLGHFSDRFVPIENDLENYQWRNDIQTADAVISSFTLDYLPPEIHHKTLLVAFELLEKKGRLLTCEFYRSDDMMVNRIFHDLEIQFVKNALAEKLITVQEIDQLDQSNILRREHHVVTIDEKMRWLKDVGFSTVEIPWKFLNLAIFSAIK